MCAKLDRCDIKGSWSNAFTEIQGSYVRFGIAPSRGGYIFFLVDNFAVSFAGGDIVIYIYIYIRDVFFLVENVPSGIKKKKKKMETREKKRRKLCIYEKRAFASIVRVHVKR